MEIEKNPIRLIDLASPSKEAELESILDDIRKLYKSSQFIMGDALKTFEVEYAKLAGAKYSIGLNSGTDALFLAFRIFGIGPGDEVITASNSFIASAAAIHLVGAKPVFVDVAEDYNIDPSKIEDAITKNTKAILPVHLTGLPCDMDPIMEIAKRKNLRVIEDSAQAIGSKYKGKGCGSFGEFGCFSLHPLKNLHVWGDGGMATTNSEELDQKMRQQRNHGQVDRDNSEFFSYNSRLDTIQAIVGMRSLKRLPETIELRRRHAKIYDERLKDLAEYVKPPQVKSKDIFHSYHLYVIWAEDRDDLQKFLLQRGIETKIHYPNPIHLQKAAAHLGYKKGDLPVTEHLAKGILSMPVRENLSDADIHRVCDSLQDFYLK